MYENIENDKMFIDKSLENFFESVPASKINSGLWQEHYTWQLA